MRRALASRSLFGWAHLGDPLALVLENRKASAGFGPGRWISRRLSSPVPPGSSVHTAPVSSSAGDGRSSVLIAVPRMLPRLPALAFTLSRLMIWRTAIGSAGCWIASPLGRSSTPQAPPASSSLFAIRRRISPRRSCRGSRFCGQFSTPLRRLASYCALAQPSMVIRGSYPYRRRRSGCPSRHTAITRSSRSCFWKNMSRCMEPGDRRRAYSPRLGPGSAISRFGTLQSVCSLETSKWRARAERRGTISTSRTSLQLSCKSLCRPSI